MRASLLVVSLSLCLHGCVDRCDPDSDVDRCEGNTIVSCPQPGPDQLVPDHWTSRECGEEQVCVLVESGTALCAIDDAPDPRCEGAPSSVCADATTQLYCSLGYATGTQDCFSCTEEEGESAACAGGFGSACASGADCVSGACNPQGHCVAS
jgi:hypothetical protein